MTRYNAPEVHGQLRATSLLTLLGVALAVPGSGPAYAQNGSPAVAEKRVDVDGDGALDLVRIDNPAAVSVLFTRPAGQQIAPIWKPFAAAVGTPVAGRIAVGTGKAFSGRTVIVAEVEFAGTGRRGPLRGRAARTGQAMVLAFTAGSSKADKLWEGSIGAQGRDGEYRIRVEAAPFGLVRYQERSDVRRCDRQPAYLFPQGFDYKRRKFRNIASPVRIPASAPTIVATPAAPGQGAQPGGRASGPIAATPAVAFRSKSVSAQAYAEHAGMLTPPRELDDGDPQTIWSEHTGGNGRGLFITLTSPMDAPEIVALRFIPGDASSRTAFAQKNRLRRLGLIVGGKHAFWISIPSDPARSRTPLAPLFATLPEGISGRCVTVVLDDVYSGRGARSKRSGETSISDLAVITDLDLSQGGPESLLIQRVVAGGAGADASARMLQRRGGNAVAAIVDALDGTGEVGGVDGELAPDAALRLRRVLARLGDPAAAGQLAIGLGAANISVADARVFRSALTRMGRAAVAALATVLQDAQAEPAGRQASARVLAEIADTGARDALIAACGQGGRNLRKEIAVGLGRRVTTDLDALMTAAEAAAARTARACEADLWRAVGLMAARAPSATQGPAARRLATRLQSGRLLGAPEDYELSYRLFDAVGRLPTDTAVTAVTDAIATLVGQDGAQSRGLRRVAAGALAGNSHVGARSALITLAGDRDPGTRAVAVAALGPRPDADARSDRVVIERLGRDRWPGIRKAAASALGHRCEKATSAQTALNQAVDGDRNIDVQRESLSALVECRAPGIGTRLIAVAGDGKRREKLRSKALSLVPQLADPALVKPLIRLFGKLRQAAWSKESAVRLASAAAVAMGRTGSADVVAPLLRAARESSFPEIQAAAVTGLGEICPPKARRLFADLLGSDQRAVLIAARAAYNRCRR